jgi:hypothetical protein
VSLQDQLRGQLAAPAPHLQVEPQRELFGTTGLFNVPALGTAVASVVLTTTDAFSVDDGLLYEYLFGSIIPNVSDGALTISDLVLVLRFGTFSLIELATPILTTLVPRNATLGTSLLFSPTPLLQMRTLTGLDGVRNGLGLSIAFPQAIPITLQVGFVNSNAAIRQVTLNFGAIYRHVRGLQEG